MKIIVDGDGCPSRNIIEKVAKKNNVDVTIFCDINHYIVSEYSEVIVVDSGFQSVDISLINKTKSNDLVITQDYGLAAMALGKKAFAINPKGYIYNEDNIDDLLLKRHVSQKMRKAGLKTSNPKKRSVEDDVRLEKNLNRIIKDHIKN